MRQMRVEDAIGQILCHDITKIVPGEFKGRAFRKGHVITAADVPELLKLGKDHLYVWEAKEGFLHENEAGLRLAQAVRGERLAMTEPSEGKINLIAECDGLLSVNEEYLLQINTIDELAVGVRGNKRPVKKGDIAAGLRVIPLQIDEEKIKLAENIGQGKNIISVKPYSSCRAGIITTGNEVYHGRIVDKFGPVVKAKVEAYGSQVIAQTVVPDDAAQISEAVKAHIASGANLILATGGMSVDPDDVTPTGIKNAGAQIVAYGAPVLPGAMMLIAYLGDVPVLGLPGCVMYCKTTVFDILLPIILTGEKITRPMVAKLGMGGLCLECDDCRYPACSFGTGL